MYWLSLDSFQQLELPVTIGLVLLLIWSLGWKGWALWLAARRAEKLWFIVLLLFNTAGLLEIFYIFVIARRSDKQLNLNNHE